jgi:hypothetical protein
MEKAGGNESLITKELKEYAGGCSVDDICRVQ